MKLAGFAVGLAMLASSSGLWAEPSGRPAAEIDYSTAPFRMTRVLGWGSRPDWSADGRKLAFTESDVRDTHAYELDLATRTVRCLTCRLGMAGMVTRVYYLPDGSFLLLAPRNIGSEDVSRRTDTISDVMDQELYWMSAPGAPLQPLGAPAFGEIAISRDVAKDGSVRLGWGELRKDRSLLHIATLSLANGRASLSDGRILYDSAKRHEPASVTMSEAYGFADNNRALTFYTILADGKTVNGEMYQVDIASGKLSSLYDDPAHSETHLFPDERYGLEETNRSSDPAGAYRGVSSHDAGVLSFVAKYSGMRLPSPAELADYAPHGMLKGFDRPFDLYVVRRDGAAPPRRLTRFSELGVNTHQSAPAPDGRRIAFAVDLRGQKAPTVQEGLYIGEFGPAN